MGRWEGEGNALADAVVHRLIVAAAVVGHVGLKLAGKSGVRVDDRVGWKLATVDDVGRVASMRLMLLQCEDFATKSYRRKLRWPRLLPQSQDFEVWTLHCNFLTIAL